MSAQEYLARNERYEFWSVSTLHLGALTFVTLNTILLWQRGEANFIIGALYLLTFVHMGFCISRNKFSGSRKTTWVLLVLALAISEGIRFLGYIFPVDQLSASLTSTPDIGHYIGKFMQNMALMGVNLSDLGALIFLIILGLNMMAYFKINNKGEGTLERVVVLVILLTFAVLLGSALFGGHDGAATTALTQANDTPPAQWYLLPFYSALKAIPDQTGGVILLCIMLVIPVFAIFIGTPKAKGRRLFLRILMVLALTSFAGLGVLGAQPINNNTMIASQVLIAIYLSYFVIGTFLTPRPEN
jgi:quinol-cytochrome oxidoreductase complex cytochrome b subunit